MENNTIITEIEGVKFYYGGWNNNGWHLVYTNLYNFHVGNDPHILPTEKDCKRCYVNTY